MTQTDLRQTTAAMRAILYVASGLVLMVSISLFFMPDQTERFFAWTINPPLTAAFLGGGYLTSFVLEFLSARERIWVRARPSVPGVWVFTLLTLIVTLVHIDRFHFNSPTAITVIGTWVWLAVYVSVPIAMGLFWIGQVRQPGLDPPRVAPLPGWLRLVLLAQGAIMLLLGAVMLVSPGTIIPAWPWTLSPLTARAIGAWGVGIGVIVIQAAWENDWWRLFPMMISYALYGLLQLINLARFPATVNWASPAAIVYTIFMGTVLAVGAFGAWRAWPLWREREGGG